MKKITACILSVLIVLASCLTLSACSDKDSVEQVKRALVANRAYDTAAEYSGTYNPLVSFEIDEIKAKKNDIYEVKGNFTRINGDIYGEYTEDCTFICTITCDGEYNVAIVSSYEYTVIGSDKPTVWVCRCGMTPYRGEQVPDDYYCTNCGSSKSDFTKVDR